MEILKIGKHVINCPVCEATLLYNESDISREIHGHGGKRGQFTEQYIICPICKTEFRIPDGFVLKNKVSIK